MCVSLLAGACDELPASTDVLFACDVDSDCAEGWSCVDTGAARACSNRAAVVDAGAHFMADAGRADAGGPDAGSDDDAGAGDAGLDDAGLDDAGPVDAGLGDAGPRDAGLEDAGVGDAGLNDAGLGDAGLNDAGLGDAGVVDAGPNDAGFGDAGFGDGGPCTGVPTALALACDDPDGGATSCEAALTDEASCPVVGRAAAILCDATVGRTMIGQASFDATDGGGCDLGGWSLHSGDLCSDSMTAECAYGGSVQTCVSDPLVACVDTDGSTGLTIDLNEQLRLSRTFDLTGLTDAEVCFRSGETGATSNDAFAVFASDGVTTSTVYCAVGDQSGDTTLRPTCVQLPAFIQGAAAATITFALHSNDNGDRIHLDDLSVRGSPTACAEVVLVDEDFSSCDGATSFSGWTVVAGSLNCPTNFDCPDQSERAEVDNTTASIERTLDLTGYEDARACFFLGEDGSDVNDGITVEVDTGTGYVEAFGRSGDLGANQVCREYCASLSDADPLVDGHPALKLRLAMFSNGGKVDVDEFRVFATARCAADTTLQGFTGVIETAPGLYTTTGASMVPLDVELVCTEAPSDASAAAAFTLFR